MIMSHLFISMNFVRFHKYYIDVISTKDISAINNLLTPSGLIKCLMNSNTYSRNEFKSLEEQIFCKAYGKMKVSTP